MCIITVIDELNASPGNTILNIGKDSVYFGRNHSTNMQRGKYTAIAANTKSDMIATREPYVSFSVSFVVLLSVGYNTVEIADIATVTSASILYANEYFAYTSVSNKTRTNCLSRDRISVEQRFAKSNGKPILLKENILSLVDESDKASPLIMLRYVHVYQIVNPYSLIIYITKNIL